MEVREVKNVGRVKFKNQSSVPDTTKVLDEFRVEAKRFIEIQKSTGPQEKNEKNL